MEANLHEIHLDFREREHPFGTGVPEGGFSLLVCSVVVAKPQITKTRLRVRNVRLISAGCLHLVS